MPKNELTEKFLDRLGDVDNDYDEALRVVAAEETEGNPYPVWEALDDDHVPTAFYDDVIDTYLGLTGVWWSSPDLAYRSTLHEYAEAGLTEIAFGAMLERHHGL